MRLLTPLVPCIVLKRALLLPPSFPLMQGLLLFTQCSERAAEEEQATEGAASGPAEAAPTAAGSPALAVKLSLVGAALS